MKVDNEKHNNVAKSSGHFPFLLLDASNVPDDQTLMNSIRRIVNSRSTVALSRISPCYSSTPATFVRRDAQLTYRQPSRVSKR